MESFAAVDLGAQSGRVAIGSFDGERLTVEIVHRFATAPTHSNGRLRWDAIASYREVLQGLAAASRDANIVSVAVDSWAVDFGLFDSAGALLENPVHYRDSGRSRDCEAVFARIGRRELYDRTGIQLMPINSIFQLAAMADERDPLLERAEHLLLLPDILHYWLCGARTSEFTNAVTTQCIDLATREWALDLTDRLGIPHDLFPQVVPPGSVLGHVTDERSTLGGASVIAGATHDTAAAVAATPLRGRNAAYLSVGTWSLVGIESDTPVAGDAAFAANLTNEAGVGDTYRVLRNVAGLWLLDECRRTWALEGRNRPLDVLLNEAEAAPAFEAFIDPNDPAFAGPGDMPSRIVAYCQQTGQHQPDSEGAVARCILESLALKHAETVDLLATAARRSIDELNVVGGGANNALLCAWTAAATQLPVSAGPVEATLVGNLLVQAIALGEIDTLEEARAVVAESFVPATYDPSEGSAWREARERFASLDRSYEEVVQ